MAHVHNLTMNNIYNYLKRREFVHNRPRLHTDDIETNIINAYNEKESRKRKKRKLAMERAAFKFTGNKKSKLPVNLDYKSFY